MSLAEPKLSERIETALHSEFRDDIIDKLVSELVTLENEAQRLTDYSEEWHYKYNYEYQWHQRDNQRIRDDASKLAHVEFKLKNLEAFCEEILMVSNDRRMILTKASELIVSWENELENNPSPKGAIAICLKQCINEFKKVLGGE